MFTQIRNSSLNRHVPQRNAFQKVGRGCKEMPDERNACKGEAQYVNEIQWHQGMLCPLLVCLAL